MDQHEMNFICTHGQDLEKECFPCNAENSSNDKLDLREIVKDLKKIFWIIVFGLVLIGMLLLIVGA